MPTGTAGDLQPIKPMKTRLHLFLLSALIAVLNLIPAGRVTAQTFTILHRFDGNDGYDPEASLVLSGNTLYGTTADGACCNCLLRSGLEPTLAVFDEPADATRSTALSAASSGSKQQLRIVEKFTRRAEAFATAPALTCADTLNLLVQMSNAGPRATLLGVACGAGLFVYAFAEVVRRAAGIDLTPAMIQRAQTMVEELRLLCRDEVELITQRTGLVNQLQAALHEYSK